MAVPLYDTLGREAIGHIFDKGTQKPPDMNRTPLSRRSGTRTPTCALRSVSAAISTVICDVPKKAQLILDCVNGKGKTVKRIVVMEVFETDLVTRAQTCGIEIISLKEFEVRLFNLRCSKSSVRSVCIHEN